MKWSEREISYLKENYSANPNMEEMCKKLNKSSRAILHKGTRLGLSRGRHLSRVYPERTPRIVIEKRYYHKNREKIYIRKKERLTKMREELKNMLGGKCSKCGYDKCLSALDFHHISKEKEGNISYFIKDFSKEKSLKEIKKCILLCANCHRELHHGGL